MNRFSFLTQYGLSIITAAVILYLCILKPAELPQVETFVGFDKLVHIIMYFGFGLVLNFDLGRKSPSTRKFVGAPVFLILYGGIIELLQAYCFPPRTGEWADFVADIVGTGLACLVFHKILKNRLNVAKKNC